MESSHLLLSSFHVALYKTLFFDFRFRPPNAQNLLPQIWRKIAYNSACMADRPETFGPTIYEVFGDGRFNGSIQNIVGPTLVAMATKFDLGAEI